MKKHPNCALTVTVVEVTAFLTLIQFFGVHTKPGQTKMGASPKIAICKPMLFQQVE